MSEKKQSPVVPSKEIARFLLKIKAVKFNVQSPYTWTSGIKSPIYCDNRVINSYVDARDTVVSELANAIKKNYLKEKNIDIIAAVATGGVPFGVLAADRLKLPFIYVRDKRKEHGMMNIIEGVYERGQKLILIEDHISTGLSSNKSIQGLREAGLDVAVLLSIMTYRFKVAEDLFLAENVEHASLCDLDTVLKVAHEEGILQQSEVDTILQFRDNPQEWQL